MKPKQPRSAFTLIELIAVMGIIVALALVVIGSYSGMSRAIAAEQGVRQVRDALLLARQTACVNGSRIYCYILEEDQYVLCRKIGTSTGNETTHASYTSGKDPEFVKDSYPFSDYYTDLGGFVNDIDKAAQDYAMTNSISLSSGNAEFAYDALLFDLSETEKERKAVTASLRGVRRNKGSIPGWTLYYRTSDDNPLFKEGADYGIALFPIRVLPKGFTFLEDDIGKYVYFEPTGNKGGPLSKIVVAETAVPDRTKTVEISSNGTVK